jgi:hypothetical protein
LKIRHVVGIGLLVLIPIGCGDGKPPPEPVYPVKGEVFYKGKPAAGAVVWLHRIGAEEVNAGQPATMTPPRGTVQEDGSFQISTYGENDGAPVGQYRMTVRWTKAKGGGDDEENLLPLRYMDPKTANLPMIEVKAEPLVLAKFNLIP